ncbi:glycosyltransferase [Neisseria animalis]|uniref:Glycosyltransferase n=1 Tax=Neisseria animalis TaxID=492 RepID=A0A5P3MRA3_NEIAN|nr:glycosyltransferase [Neisseria animalis]QEY23311.1 glycosyltransferase [Neisseria animalis]ROW33160.1 glycosyltransferase [Neisseria animalis]VEE08657.1 glycosyl transferase family protein [Neisseria animalis]
MAFFSLIVPVYNGSRFIDNLIRNLSALHGAVADTEFILINDGSTDDTSERLNAFLQTAQARALNVKLIETDNGGVSRARNIGLAAATGRYAAFMDHDDNIDAPKLAALLEQAAEIRADLLHFNADSRYMPSAKTLRRDSFLTEVPFTSYVWAYVFKRELLVRHALRFDENMSYLEDGLFVLGYLRYADSILASGQQVYGYTDNPQSVMRAKRTAAQNQKFLDDIGAAVRGYSKLSEDFQAVGDTAKRLREIRDSFQFIHLVNMLKLGIGRQELFERLQAAGYDYALRDYPSRFNKRFAVKILCMVFRSKAALGILADSRLPARR